MPRWGPSAGSWRLLLCSSSRQAGRRAGGWVGVSTRSAIGSGGWQRGLPGSSGTHLWALASRVSLSSRMAPTHVQYGLAARTAAPSVPAHPPLRDSLHSHPAAPAVSVVSRALSTRAHSRPSPLWCCRPRAAGRLCPTSGATRRYWEPRRGPFWPALTSVQTPRGEAGSSCAACPARCSASRLVGRAPPASCTEALRRWPPCHCCQPPS